LPTRRYEAAAESSSGAPRPAPCTLSCTGGASTCFVRRARLARLLLLLLLLLLPLLLMVLLGRMRRQTVVPVAVGRS
jgi:hypothetical protein